MRTEHCSGGDHETIFKTDNYNIETCPAKEWAITVDKYKFGKFGRPDLGHNRELVTIEELMKKEIVQSAKLTRCEVIAVVLYTCPMVR